MAHRYNVRRFLFWSCTSSLEDIMAALSTFNFPEIGGPPSSKKVLDGQLQTLSESEANEWCGCFFGKFLRRLCAKPHTGCTCPKQFSHESMSTCARRNYWWGEEHLDVIYQTYAKFTYHTSTGFSCSSRSTTIDSCASRCATGMAPSWSCGAWEWERCQRDLVKPSKTAPRILRRNQENHIQQRYIWWIHRDPNG